MINACQDTMFSMSVNMAERPSTTATPSNQYIVKCSVRGHHVYKTYGVLALVSSLRCYAKRTTNATSDCSSEKQFNSSWSHPEGDNPHLPLLHQEQRGDNWWSKQKITVLHSSLWRSGNTMPTT